MSHLPKGFLASNRLHHHGDDDDETLARISVSRPSSYLLAAVRCAGGRASSPEIALGGAGAAAEGREGGKAFAKIETANNPARERWRGERKGGRRQIRSSSEQRSQYLPKYDMV